jgi:hypothetical protein
VVAVATVMGVVEAIMAKMRIAGVKAVGEEGLM